MYVKVVFSLLMVMLVHHYAESMAESMISKLDASKRQVERSMSL